MRLIGFLSCTIFIYAFFAIPPVAYAQTAAEIQAKIDANNAQIKQLQSDIAAYQKQVDALGAKKSTLQSAITSLSISQKQLASEIQVTQNKISSANLKIQSLTTSIRGKEAAISENQVVVAKAIRGVAQEESSPLVAKLISSDSFGAAWKMADAASQFDKALVAHINELKTLRTQLVSNRDDVAAEKSNLLALQTDLSGQKRAIDVNKATQQQLLSQTKNQESNYQKLIAQKQAAEKSFEQELINLQGQLNLIVHPEKLPKIGAGVLNWPFPDSFMRSCKRLTSALGNAFCVTQYFGNTAFATANPQVYKGKGHNAIDIGAPIGTPVQAALDGVVLGTGNTDLIRGCYSFGKWIMVVHGNGLSTMYSHLSAIDVAKGQTVSAGQIIGLSGMSGYATGPHIHFGVYATEGTQIMTLRQFRGATIGCADATMPVATLTAYLNPLSYL